MQERAITIREPAAIRTKQRRRNRRIAEPWMPFHMRRPSFGHVAPRSFKSVVITLLACVGDWRRRGIHCHRLRMRTSRKTQGQQQSRQCNPFLHLISSRGKIERPAKPWSDACWLEHSFAQSVA
jgi:hypothetical protein